MIPGATWLTKLIVSHLLTDFVLQPSSWVALVILGTHFLIDGWKSYRPKRIRYFLIDQVLHLVVITACWLGTFQDWVFWDDVRRRINTDVHAWIVLAAFVFVTTPAGILIGQITSGWSKKIDDPDNSLANAGKRIGILGRVIVLILVLLNQYSAIGLVIAAKSILRFSEIRLWRIHRGR